MSSASDLCESSLGNAIAALSILKPMNTHERFGQRFIGWDLARAPDSSVEWFIGPDGLKQIK